MWRALFGSWLPCSVGMLKGKFGLAARSLSFAWMERDFLFWFSTHWLETLPSEWLKTYREVGGNSLLKGKFGTLISPSLKCCLAHCVYSKILKFRQVLWVWKNSGYSSVLKSNLTNILVIQTELLFLILILVRCCFCKENEKEDLRIVSSVVWCSFDCILCFLSDTQNLRVLAKGF